MRSQLTRRAFFRLATAFMPSKLWALSQKNTIKPGAFKKHSNRVVLSGILSVSKIDILSGKRKYQIYGDGHSHTIQFNDEAFQLLQKDRKIIIRSDFGIKQDHSHWVTAKIL